MKDEVTASDIFGIIWRKRFAIVIITLCCAIIGGVYGYVKNTKPQSVALDNNKTVYSASVDVRFSINSDMTLNTEDDIAASHGLTILYSEKMNNQKYIKQLMYKGCKYDYDEFRDIVDISDNSNNQIITVSVKTNNKAECKEILKSVEKVCANIKADYNVNGYYFCTDMTPIHKEPATISIKAKFIKFFVVFGAGGFIAICVCFAVFGIIKPKVNNADADESRSDGFACLVKSLPKSLNAIGLKTKKGSVKPVDQTVYQSIFEKIYFSAPQKKIVLFTAHEMDAAMAETVKSIAAAGSENGHKVLLIDADIRNSRLENRSGNGLAQAAANGTKPEIVSTSNGYSFINAGKATDDISLTLKNSNDVIAQCANDFDVTMVVSSGTKLPDPMILSSSCTASVALAIRNVTEKRDFYSAINTMNMTPATVIGTVIISE